jgi:hypothetical protein
MIVCPPFWSAEHMIFVCSTLQGRDIGMHPEMGQNLVSSGILYRTIPGITEGSTWGFTMLTISNLVCWTFIILMHVIWRAEPECDEPLVDLISGRCYIGWKSIVSRSGSSGVTVRHGMHVRRMSTMKISCATYVRILRCVHTLFHPSLHHLFVCLFYVFGDRSDDFWMKNYRCFGFFIHPVLQWVFVSLACLHFWIRNSA